MQSEADARAAEIIANNLREIYPGPVQTAATQSLGEVNQTRAPAVLVELAYHDNPEDAMWISANLPSIGENLASSVAEFFGTPMRSPWGQLQTRLGLE